MTAREAAIVTAYTGISIGPFANAHKYIEEVLGRQVQAGEMQNMSFWAEVQEASTGDFLAIETAIEVLP